MSDPLVSVILATFNYSSVLRCAIRSVLEQVFRNFELLVIGDGCTDDSAEVAASFRDERIRWHNLPENSGHQSAPNNAGLAMARGKYVAYLGHDDLWLPHHLARMVEKAEECGADAAFSLSILIARGTPIRVLTGWSPSGEFQPDLAIPASTILSRTDAAREVGGWHDYRTIHSSPDIAFLTDLWAAGKRIVPVREVTVLKFPSPWRKDSYQSRLSADQEYYLAKLHDPWLLVSELTATALAYAEGNVRSPVALPAAAAGAPSGDMIDRYREQRGLPRASGERAPRGLHNDPAGLRVVNRRRDIVPQAGLDALFEKPELPRDAILVGRGWHEVESHNDEVFRWLNTDAELILTRPFAETRKLVLEAESGPSQGCRPFELQLAKESGEVIGRAEVAHRREISFELPDLGPEGATLRLMAPSGGITVAGDPRILNLRVFSVRRAGSTKL